MFENNDQLLPPLPAVVTEPTLEHMLRHFEVEQFLIEEAALLDQGKFQDWLALFAEDVRYWMPIRRTMTTKDTARQFTRPGQMAFIDDDHAMLAMRVRRLKTGYAWAEDPPPACAGSSRTFGSPRPPKTKSKYTRTSTHTAFGWRKKRIRGSATARTDCAASMAPSRSGSGRSLSRAPFCNLRT